MLYLRFVICLALGLFGLSLLLSTLMDALLSEWDMLSDARRALSRLSKKARPFAVPERNMYERAGRETQRVMREGLPAEVLDEVPGMLQR